MKADRNSFARQHAGQTLDLGKVANDPNARRALEQAGVSLDKLRQADRDGTGLIDAGEAFRVADDFDRDGNSATLNVGGTRAGRALQALSQALEPRTPCPFLRPLRRAASASDSGRAASSASTPCFVSRTKQPFL